MQYNIDNKRCFIITINKNKLKSNSSFYLYKQVKAINDYCHQKNNALAQSNLALMEAEISLGVNRGCSG